MLQSSSRGGSPWSGGVFSLVWGGVCLVPGGSPWWWGCLPGPGGVLPAGGLAGPGGVLPAGGGSAWSQGRCLPGSGGFSGDPPVNRITDTCKNITLATTSLRPVIIYTFLFHTTGMSEQLINARLLTNGTQLCDWSINKYLPTMKRNNAPLGIKTVRQ